MTDKRIEEDVLGSCQISKNTLYGIHTHRALENFKISARLIKPGLIHAYGAVKLACLRTNHAISPWPIDVFNSMEQACFEMMEAKLDSHILVDALQGGAGTSTNMNVNEVLANRALQILNKPLGSYDIIDPLEDINLHQSTNDTYPTALKIAAISGVRLLADNITKLQNSFQRQESQCDDIVKVGRTQMQDAVLTTLGREMSAYAECLSRDRWRIFKCEERLRVVNLGGTAIGTGLGAPKKYIFRVVENLRNILGFGLTRGDNLVDITQNADAFVEVSGMLKTLAVNLQKIAGDLRFMSSGPESGIGEISLPPMQAGSSIMPNKINPVILEAVIQVSLKVIANDQVITSAASMGNLELNAFMPIIADSLLDSIELLSNICCLMSEKCVDGISPNIYRCNQFIKSSTASLTAFVDMLGYHKLNNLLSQANNSNCNIKDMMVNQGLCTAQEYDRAVSAEQVMKLGSN